MRPSGYLVIGGLLQHLRAQIGAELELPAPEIAPGQEQRFHLGAHGGPRTPGAGAGAGNGGEGGGQQGRSPRPWALPSPGDWALLEREVPVSRLRTET